MKNILLILLLVVSTINVYGQEKMKRQRTFLDYNTGYNNVIKINPVSLGIGNISLSYERFLSERFSLQLQAGYWVGGKVENTKWSGISVTPEVRLYLTNELRPAGLYTAVFGRYQQIESQLERSESQIEISRIGGGVALGYQILFGTRVVWDIFAGGQFLSNNIDANGLSTKDYWYFKENFGLRAGTTLGIVF